MRRFAARWGARTLDGVKRRTRAGMGRCQAGFCLPRTLEILAEELGFPRWKLQNAAVTPVYWSTISLNRRTSRMREVDLVVIGGGPAGLAAALAARDAGCKNLLILEREPHLGGILRQCIHSGFGLHTFQEELTGPEYAQRFIDRVIDADIPVQCGTTVLSLFTRAHTDLRLQGQRPGTVAGKGCRAGHGLPRTSARRVGNARMALCRHLYGGHGATIGESGGAHAGQARRHPGQRGHWSHHGPPHDVCGRRSESLRRTDAIFCRAQAQHCAVPG